MTDGDRRLHSQGTTQCSWSGSIGSIYSKLVGLFHRVTSVPRYNYLACKLFCGINGAPQGWGTQSKKVSVHFLYLSIHMQLPLWCIPAALGTWYGADSAEISETFFAHGDACYIHATISTALFGKNVFWIFRAFFIKPEIVGISFLFRRFFCFWVYVYLGHVFFRRIALSVCLKTVFWVMELLKWGAWEY